MNKLRHMKSSRVVLGLYVFFSCELDWGVWVAAEGGINNKKYNCKRKFDSRWISRRSILAK